MACEYCGKSMVHDYRCPNYIPQKTMHYCSFCGDGIRNGEEYIVNQDHEYRHYDCFCRMKDLLGWLGYEIKTMEDEHGGE